MQKQQGTFQIQIKHPSQGLIDWLEVEEDTTVAEVTKMISNQHSEMNQKEITLKHKGVPLADGKKLSDYELEHCSSVQVLDDTPTDIDAKDAKILVPVNVQGLMQ